MHWPFLCSCIPTESAFAGPEVTPTGHSVHLLSPKSCSKICLMSFLVICDVRLFSGWGATDLFGTKSHSVKSFILKKEKTNAHTIEKRKRGCQMWTWDWLRKHLLVISDEGHRDNLSVHQVLSHFITILQKMIELTGMALMEAALTEEGMDCNAAWCIWI